MDLLHVSIHSLRSGDAYIYICVTKDYSSHLGLVGNQDEYKFVASWFHVGIARVIITMIYKTRIQQGKSEGFDSCDRPSNLT